MFIINVNGEKKRCFNLTDGGLSIYDFNNDTIESKLGFNKALSAINATTDINAVRAFYIGVATKFMNSIKIVPGEQLDINYALGFRALFNNASYFINEEVMSSFNKSLFVDECVNIFNIRINPLLTNTSNVNSKKEVHHYITNVTVPYSADFLDTLNKYDKEFISGMSNFSM